MTERDDRTIDQAVEAALGRIPVPDHAPGFWERLDARLTSEADVGLGAGVDVTVDPGRRNGFHGGTDLAPHGRDDFAVPPPRLDRRGRGGPGRRRLTVAATVVAAVAAIAVAVVLVGDPDGGNRVEIGPSDTKGAETPTTSTLDPTTSTSDPTSSTSAPDVPPGSEDAVLRFLDAVARGDVAGAGMGPLSEAYVSADGTSVEDYLRQAAEGYGAWADAEDRTTSTVVLGPGDVVVVVSGRVQLEGTVEERTEAFPVRYAQSAGGWLVEPRALEPAQSGQMQLDTPAPNIGGAPPTLDRIDRVVATTPGDGTAWLALDDQPPMATTVGADGEASWSLDDPVPPGRHVLTIAFVNDSSFAAVSQAFLVAS